jgi:hypothetical protein
MDSLQDKSGKKKVEILRFFSRLVDLGVDEIGTIECKGVCEHKRSAYKRRAFTFGWHPATSTTNLSWPTPFGLYGIYLNSLLFH